MHPGTQIYNTPRYGGWSSLEPMWTQVDEIGSDVVSIGAAFPEGINLIGYSQGGLLARAILQRFPDHNVRNFISLSSPQAGQYGSMRLQRQFLKTRKVVHISNVCFDFQRNFCIYFSRI